MLRWLGGRGVGGPYTTLCSPAGTSGTGDLRGGSIFLGALVDPTGDVFRVIVEPEASSGFSEAVFGDRQLRGGQLCLDDLYRAFVAGTAGGGPGCSQLLDDVAAGGGGCGLGR